MTSLQRDRSRYAFGYRVKDALRAPSTALPPPRAPKRPRRARRSPASASAEPRPRIEAALRRALSAGRARALSGRCPENRPAAAHLHSGIDRKGPTGQILGQQRYKARQRANASRAIFLGRTGSGCQAFSCGRPRRNDGRPHSSLANGRDCMPPARPLRGTPPGGALGMRRSGARDPRARVRARPTAFFLRRSGHIASAPASPSRKGINRTG